MKDFLLHYSVIFILFPLFGCQKSKQNSIEFDQSSYIKDFELIQENASNQTRVKITSPKAILDPTNNDIEIFNSSIEILNKNGNEINMKSGKTILNNSKNLIRVYNKVNISLIPFKKSFIETNSFDWDLNSSNINLNRPLHINFENTTISSSNGFYNIDSGHLKINNNIFNRNIFNNKGDLIYQVIIISDMAKWIKANNSLEFSSQDKQVEATINFLRVK